MRQALAQRAGRQQALGDNVEANYRAYLDWWIAQGVVKIRVDVKDMIANEPLDDVNKFDADAIRRDAKAFQAKGCAPQPTGRDSVSGCDSRRPHPRQT